MKYRFAATTHPGKVRSRNEDALFIDEDLGLAIVADGVGGNRSGQLASSIVIDVVSEDLGTRIREGDLEDPEQALSDAIELANFSLRTVARANPQEHNGMGSTVVALLIRDGRYWLAHVGDSRVYRIRSGQLEQLTRDHSYISQELAEGRLTPEQAAEHPMRNYLTRAVGGGDDLEVETAAGRIKPGDMFLLCSDGFSDAFESNELARLASEPVERLEALAEGLVHRAVELDGSDNTTLVVVQVEPAPAAVATGAPEPAAAPVSAEEEAAPVAAREEPTAEPPAAPKPAARQRQWLRYAAYAAVGLLAVLGGYLGVQHFVGSRWDMTLPTPAPVAQLGTTPTAPPATRPPALATATPQPTTAPTATAVPPTPPPPTPTAVPRPTRAPVAPSGQAGEPARPTSDNAFFNLPSVALAAYRRGHEAADLGDMVGACQSFVELVRTSKAAYLFQVEANKLASSTQSTLQRYGDQLPLFFLFERGYFFVYAGLFPTKEAAEAGLEGFPPPLRRNKPVLRSTRRALARVSCDAIGRGDEGAGT